MFVDQTSSSCWPLISVVCSELWGVLAGLFDWRKGGVLPKPTPGAFQASRDRSELEFGLDARILRKEVESLSERCSRYMFLVVIAFCKV